ncbi:MAG: hypothetical protein ACYDAG_16735, partial [Chloroflexota bacterium]
NIVLLLFMQKLVPQELRSPAPLIHACAAMLLLLAATTLSVYNPRGITPHGWRKQRERRARHTASPAAGAPAPRRHRR